MNDIQFISDIPFDEHAIKKYIRTNAKHDFCDFTKKNVPSIDIVELAEFIEESFRTEYGEPYELGGGYDKEAVYYEDRFPGLEVETTKEMLENHLSVNDEDVYELLERHIETEYWTLETMYSPSGHEYLYDGWKSFCEIIKHKMRFMFFNEKSKKIKGNEEYHLNPYFVLDEIGKSIKKLGLLKKYEKKQLKIYRARQHNKTTIVNNSIELGSPPPMKAQANRMSPAGIPMFYGAFDNKTIISEIIDKSLRSSVITYGKFLNQKKIYLIDFCDLQYISIFDVDKRHYRDEYFFIKDFIEDLKKPILNDGIQHIEYIPTQVVTEYFRNVYAKDQIYSIAGLIYPSTKNKDGKCVVLFLENEDITNDFSDRNKILSLETTSLKSITI